jgi:hypothetical protein
MNTQKEKQQNCCYQMKKVTTGMNVGKGMA